MSITRAVILRSGSHHTWGGRTGVLSWGHGARRIRNRRWRALGRPAPRSDSVANGRRGERIRESSGGPTAARAAIGSICAATRIPTACPQSAGSATIRRATGGSPTGPTSIATSRARRAPGAALLDLTARRRLDAGTRAVGGVAAQRPGAMGRARGLCRRTADPAPGSGGRMGAGGVPGGARLTSPRLSRSP